MRSSSKLWGLQRAVETLVEFLRDETTDILNLGSQDTTYGGLNVDLKATGVVHILGNALSLPFQDRCFDLVIFTEVLEHLPVGREGEALHEIRRIMNQEGTLVLTTPRDSLVYRYSDPSFLLRGHRHYRMKDVEKLLRQSGFEVIMITIRGGIENLIWTAAHVLLVYLLSLPLPRVIEEMMTRVYSEENPRGATVFAVARKATEWPPLRRVSEEPHKGEAKEF